MLIADPVSQVFRLFDKFGSSCYDEEVTLTEHCVQTAAHAMCASASDSLVAAALLHDIGHLLLAELRGHEDFRSTEWNHDRVGADWLRPTFGRAVALPVGAHVDAKRWLCFAEPEYFDSLSPASVDSLAVQGGAFSAEEAEAFESLPYAQDAIALRRWDERGKVAGAVVPPLSEFEPLLLGLVVN